MPNVDILKKIRKLPSTSWEIETSKMDLYEYGYVNIFTDYEQTIGEQVLCIFRKKDIKHYINKKYYGYTLAILCNSCFVKSGIYDLYNLNAGQIIPIQFNGPNIPTVPLEWIKFKFWTID